MEAVDSIIYAALEELKDRRHKLENAIDHLEPLVDVPQFETSQTVAKPQPMLLVPHRRKRRTMTADARKRISLAAKRRWRLAKRDGRNSLAAAA